MRNGDQVVYVVISNPGGVDGKDHTDKGGKVTYASFYKSDADGKANAYGTVKARAVNMESARAKALAKLNPIDRLALDLDDYGQPDFN